MITFNILMSSLQISGAGTIFFMESPTQAVGSQQIAMARQLKIFSHAFSHAVTPREDPD
jgi:hypothetical protein